MHGITDHPDDFDREWAYRRGYAHGAEAVVAALRPHLPEAVRRKADLWLASELIFFLEGAVPTKNDAAPGIPFEVGSRSRACFERLGRCLVERCFSSLLWRG